MNIIIVGCGKVGFALANQLSQENHDITIIDNSPKAIEKAQETLGACMQYGMTEEFVVSERYCSSAPFYNPWQPNASGSARLMESMLKVYGERTV